MIGRNSGIAGASIAAAVIFIALISEPLLFRSVIGRDSRLSCASNLRQLGLGLAQYEQDNDEKLPPRQNASGAGGALVSWRYLIYPYIKSRDSFRCPSNPAGPAPASQALPLATDDLSRSYAVNATHDDPMRSLGPFADAYGRGFSLDSSEAPGQTIAIVESTAAFSDFNPLFPEGFARKTNAAAQSGNLFSGHNRVTNAAFLDGHVQAMLPSHMLSQSGVNPWTVDTKPFTPMDEAKAAAVMQYSEKIYHEMREGPVRRRVFFWDIGRS
ncbi:hypothetical protein CCAX7_17290 [Capsulimonas corticalis]|uniref:Uncharacterized protein n=1 Tax=Capsulimonas corticalis TaxID=2219043 RepID=A0A402D3U3_9BACT|nr:DUF1559 domain-containing protein [Capsulimonas corticalis]BDI29678.1 hypothetical protein CCAX7_17290 [Capsulimonas corticalis]